MTSGTANQRDDVISVLAFALDRLDGYRSAHGDKATHGILAQVAQAVRELEATVGVIAAAYANGVIADRAGANSRMRTDWPKSLHAAVPKLWLPNPKSIVSDHFIASVAAITGPRGRAIDRVHLLTRAISGVQEVAVTGGDRDLALSVEEAERNA